MIVPGCVWTDIVLVDLGLDVSEVSIDTYHSDKVPGTLRGGGGGEGVGPRLI